MSERVNGKINKRMNSLSKWMNDEANRSTDDIRKDFSDTIENIDDCRREIIVRRFADVITGHWSIGWLNGQFASGQSLTTDDLRDGDAIRDVRLDPTSVVEPCESRRSRLTHTLVVWTTDRAALEGDRTSDLHVRSSLDLDCCNSTMKMYCTVLFCIALCYIVFYYAVLNYTELYCIALLCIEMHCIDTIVARSVNVFVPLTLFCLHWHRCI